MQFVKSMVVAGCLLIATTAQAQYGSEYDEYGSREYQGQPDRSPYI